MANVKLSAIASGGAFVSSTDQFVAVRSGTTDNLISLPLLNTNSDNTANIPVWRLPVSGTSKTLALTDQNSIQNCSNASNQNITIPLNASVAFPVGTVISFEQNGVGTVTVTGAGGVTVNGTSGGSQSTSAQNTGMYAVKEATDTWYIEGGAAAVGAGSFTTISSSGARSSSLALNTLVGTTAGNVKWTEPEQGSTFKLFVAQAIGYENNSAVNQTITFTTPFVNTPHVLGNNTSLTITATTTTLTITAPNNTTIFNGTITVIGY